jgi:hypothetical protein
LLIVVAAAIGTAYIGVQRIGMNLSFIETAASLFGMNETAVTHEVGYTPQPAAYCTTGQQPTFTNGLAQLKQQVGDPMGTPVECEHPSSAAGDTEQQTTTGLATYTKNSNTVSFTDGWRHWALTPDGLATWEGTDSTPPA